MPRHTPGKLSQSSEKMTPKRWLLTAIGVMVMCVLPLTIIYSLGAAMHASWLSAHPLYDDRSNEVRALWWLGTAGTSLVLECVGIVVLVRDAIHKKRKAAG